MRLTKQAVFLQVLANNEVYLHLGKLPRLDKDKKIANKFIRDLCKALKLLQDLGYLKMHTMRTNEHYYFVPKINITWQVNDMSRVAYANTQFDISSPSWIPVVREIFRI